MSIKGSLAVIALWKTRDFREKQAKACTEEVRNVRRSNLRKVLKRLWKTKQHREKISKIQSFCMKLKMKDPEFVQKAHDSHVSPSKKQISIFKQICGAGFKGFKLEYPLGLYRIDIANPDKKIAVEVDGRYWHKLRYQKGSDYRKDKFLKREGWKLYRIDASKKAGRELVKLLQGRNAE